MGKLPAWARREIVDPAKPVKQAEATDSPDHAVHTGYRVVKINKPPQGRWAQRIENNEIKIATFSPEKLPESPSSLESHDGGKTKEEAADFDGDAEDSDAEIETHYYPASNDSKRYDDYYNYCFYFLEFFQLSILEVFFLKFFL